MWTRKLLSRIPTRESLKNNRFLQPLSRYLHHHFLWQFNRRSVAGDVAVGVFFGLLIPVLQIPLAAAAAIFFRVNLPIAAFSTLISNPLTFPAIYYAAYRLGSLLTGSAKPPADNVIMAEIEQAIEIQKSEVQGWLPSLIEWAQSVGLPLVVGLLVMAVAGTITAYVLVNVLWKIRTRLRWRKRMIRHR